METTRDNIEIATTRTASRIRRWARYDLPVLRPSMSRATLLRLLRARA